MLQRHPLGSESKSRIASEGDQSIQQDQSPSAAQSPARSAYLRDVQRQAHGPLPAAASEEALLGGSRRLASPSEMALGPVQRRAGQQEDPAQVQQAAAQGLEGPGSSMPHLDRIQQSFGHHSVEGVSAHVGGPAAAASEAMGAEAYATGNHVAFRDQPDLHTAAHEAAHVVQQRSGVQLAGGVGQAGDAYEQHADQVADAVVRGESAQPLLDGHAGAAHSVQRQAVQRDESEGHEHEGQEHPAAAPAHPMLHMGSFGADVRKLQQSLNDHGAQPKLGVDGIFGFRTKAALEGFQNKSGLAVTGTTDAATWAALAGAPQPARDPKAGAPEIEATPDALGKHVADKMDTANSGPYGLDVGIHYSYNFEYECKQAGKPGLWNEDYRTGLASKEYFDKVGFMSWNLKPGKSASKAIKAWLKGLTIAECNSSVVAMEIDALRAGVGDEKFDKYFGSEKAEVADNQRMKIHPGTQGTPVEWFMKSPDLTKLASEKAGKGQELTDKELTDNLHIGEWYYFYNHPKYLLKHPGGAWQGENSLYMGIKGGQRMWSGLGASNVSEEGMYDEMIQAYNAPRDAIDVMTMKQNGYMGEDGGYKNKLYDPAGGAFPEVVTKEMIKHDPAYTLGGTTRKGGFLPGAGQTLDADKVKQMRDSKG